MWLQLTLKEVGGVSAKIGAEENLLPDPVVGRLALTAVIIATFKGPV